MNEEQAKTFAVIFEGLNISTLQAILDDIKEMDIDPIDRKEVEKFKIIVQDQIDRS